MTSTSELTFKPEVNSFKNISMYYPEDKFTFMLGPSKCPFGVSFNRGKGEVVLSIENGEHTNMFNEIDHQVEVFAENMEFPESCSMRRSLYQKGNYPPTLKVKLPPTATFYDTENMIRDINYIEKMDKLMCECEVSGLWQNDNAYGVSYRATKVQVIKGGKGKAVRRDKAQAYAFNDDDEDDVEP